MANKKSGSSNSNIVEIEDLLTLMRVFARNWYIVAGFLLISFLLSYVYTYRLTDIYAARTQILLKSEDTYNYQDQLYKGLGYYGLYTDNYNQVRVITSRDLIEKTIAKLNLDISYYIIGRVKTTEVYQAVPFVVNTTLYNGNLFEKDFRLKILDEEKYELSYKKGEEEVKITQPFNEEIQNGDFSMLIVRNPILNDKTITDLKAIDYMFRVHPLENLIYKFKNSLNVENVEYTSILEITLEDEIPARAVTFLDTLSKVYIEYSQQSQITVNENTLQNIDKQLKEVTEILTGIEDDLEMYKANKEILDLPKEEDEYFDKILAFDVKKRYYDMWMQSLDALENYIKRVANSTEEKLLPPSIYIPEEDDFLRTSLNELYTIQMTRNSTLFDATEQNAHIGAIDQKIELLRKNLLTYISNSRKGLKERIADLQSQISDYKGIVKGIPKKQRDLLNIERKLQVNEKMYIYLLEKRSNTIIARAGIIPEAKIIESARPAGIVKPNKKKILYFFLLGGLIISLIIVFIRQVFFYRIQSLEELRSLTSLPVLGQIPALRQKDTPDYLIVNKDPKSPITESFRGIRANLQYMATDVESRSVLITSFNPGEGKTFTSVNIATIFAKAGKRVLLLEMDLHKPKVQIALGMTSDKGVTTILIGKSKIDETIMSTEIEGLDVILSGPIPPNASELILSRNLEDIFRYGKEHYDYVIVDTPPVGMITDAQVLMNHVDITLFIANTKFAQKGVINIANEIAATHQLKNFAFILNGVKKRRSSYYHYNYGYGYGYGYGGYGYGYGYGQEKN